MKTKNFLLLCVSVVAASVFLVAVHEQQPRAITTIVSHTHQQIKNFQESLRWAEESTTSDEGALESAGALGPAGVLGPEGVVPWTNTTRPAIVTYVRGDAHARAVEFVLHAAHLPYTLLLYDLGLRPESRAIVSSYCNSSKCVIVELDLAEFPSHVRDESIHAVRPLVILHALSRVGGVIFVEPWLRWAGGGSLLAALWARAARAGVLAWPRRAAVTSLTHPRMFRQLHASSDDFLFVQMVEASRLLVADAAELARRWAACALAPDCVMPLGAQSAGCRFDKKPQYRYSGCHEQDASALSVLLGLRAGFDETRYLVREPRARWRRVPDRVARAAFLARLRNTTDAEPRTDPPASAAP